MQTLGVASSRFTQCHDFCPKYDGWLVGLEDIINIGLFAVFLGHGTYLSGWVRLVSFALEP